MVVHLCPPPAGVAGQSDVGKTCLVDRYLNGKYQDTISPTVGAAFGAKKLYVGDRPLTVGVWDTAGAERFEAMSRLYYRAARAACVCYDLTRAETWPKVKFWINELLSFEKECALYIVGTKADLLEEGVPRGVEASEVADYARQINAQVFETSSKKGYSVEDLFDTIVYDFVKRGAGGEVPLGGGGGGDVITPSEAPPACSC